MWIHLRIAECPVPFMDHCGRGWRLKSGLSSAVNVFTDRSKAVLLLWIICECLVFFMLSRLFIADVWSPAGKGVTSWLVLVMFNCVFVTF